jgi:hypothetical protein
MNKSTETAPAKRLLMVTDSVFLDQQQAQRTAFLGMIDHIAERSGVASASVALALRNPTRQSMSPASLRQAKDAVAYYLAKRTQATRPPKGLPEALNAMRSALLSRGDGSGQHLVGVSALPPAALARYAGQTELRRTFDCVYSVGHSPKEIAQTDNASPDMDWIRPLPRPSVWPSPSVMNAISALHHATPKETILIAGTLGDEIGHAAKLGMQTVYVRLAPLEKATAEIESFAPDALVTRIQDLPHHPIFQRAANEGGKPILRSPRLIDRDR